MRWFHTGGIFAGLSETTADVVVEAAEAARRHGTVVSYDLNYRPSLWQSIGGADRAREVNAAHLSRYVDVMIGNEEDFTAALGFRCRAARQTSPRSISPATREMIGAVAADLPNLEIVGDDPANRAGRRPVNDWGALAWSDETGIRTGDAA